jgi:molecular chaperone GrpE
MSKKRDQEETSEGPENRSGLEQPAKAASQQSSRAASEAQPKAAPHPKGAGDAVQPVAEAPGAGEPCAGAEEKIAELEKEAADLKDKLLRKQADFENFRKRMLREREDAARYANAALLTDIIGLIDDFERAIRSAEESKDFGTFLQGVGMIEKQFVEMLESRWGLKRFSSVGEGFDPNRHEAVQRVEGPAGSKPTVVEDFQRGYYLHERVLRPARVKVQVPASEARAPGSDGGSAAASGESRPAGG